MAQIEAMDPLIQKVQQRLSSIKADSTHKPSKYNCEICKDIEFVIENGRGRDCQCREAKKYQRILNNSGISNAFLQRNFENYKEVNPTAKKAKETALRYVQNFESIRNEKHNSIAFLGQVGAGKTHLTIAIANVLMKRNIGVLYMQYRDAITKIKQNMLDEENYQRELNRYKGASVLLIDDLFKGVKKNDRVNETDLNIIFEIVNYRYIMHLPMIISSEYGPEKLLDFDEAIGSRILERCKGWIVGFEGPELNYRLWGED